MFPKDARSQALLVRGNAFDPLPGIGSVVDKTKCLLRAIYDFTVLGGAIATIPLVDDQGNAAVLPQGAIVTNVVAHVIVAVTSAGAATVSLGSNIAGSVVDLQAATAKATLALGAFVAGVPVGTAATWVGPVTSQNGSQVQVAVAAAALTAGKIAYFIEYVISTST